MSKKLEILPSNDERNATFVLTDEDHTLGNALRYVIAKDRKTAFCGYSVPHPNEPKMNVRVQAKRDPAVELFRDGLVTLSSVSDHVLATFEAQEQAFLKVKAEKGRAAMDEDE